MIRPKREDYDSAIAFYCAQECYINKLEVDLTKAQFNSTEIPAWICEMGTVGDLFDDYVISGGRFNKDEKVYFLNFKDDNVSTN